MKNWLKFFPFAARVNNYPAEIQGPYFPALLENTWFFSNSALHFGAPMANPVFSFSHLDSRSKMVSPGSKDILKTEWDSVYGGTPGAPLDDWDLHIFYKNTWFFVGPWFSGEQARLKASALLCVAKKDFSFASKNLFHPRVFESAIANYLDTQYGYEKNGGKPMYRGPLNWRVLPVSSTIQAVVCDVHEIGNGTKNNPCLHRLVYFPVTKSHLIQINFDFGGVDINNDAVRAKPLFKLCDDIISTFRLDVGESTQNEWNRVKDTCPDMSITETMEEFPWPLKIPKKSSTPKEVDITPQQKAIE